MIRIVLADDEPLLRSGLRLILEAAGDLQVVGEAADGADAVRVISATVPDVALVDLRMPALDGVEVIRRCSQRVPSVRCLVLTTFDLDEQVVAALRAGAAGFLLKTTPPERLTAAVRTVVDGDLPLSPEVLRRVVDGYVSTRTPPVPAELENLTGREREVLVLMAQGLSNSDIAARLFLGETTVKTHINRLLAKLGLRTRVEAIAFAYRYALV